MLYKTHLEDDVLVLKKQMLVILELLIQIKTWNKQMCVLTVQLICIRITMTEYLNDQYSIR